MSQQKEQKEIFIPFSFFGEFTQHILNASAILNTAKDLAIR